jgi:hypothetical protein
MSGPGNGVTLPQDSTYNLHNDGVYNLHNDSANVTIVIDMNNMKVTVTVGQGWTTQVKHVQTYVPE